MAHGFQTAGRAVETVTVIALIGYAGYRVWLYRSMLCTGSCRGCKSTNWHAGCHPRDKDKILLMDVRSHGYYDAGAARIKGSIRVEPNNLAEEMKTLPKDKDIYVYCT